MEIPRMNFVSTTRLAVLAMAGTLMFTSCDWESGTKANSSNSGKVGEFNLTNVYRGILDGSMRAVSNPSRGRITSLNLMQSGKSVEIFDNQGSRYSGFVGNGVTQATNTTPPQSGSGTDDDDGGDSNTNAISSGRSITTYPLGFSGFDRVANKNVEFSGVIEVVTQSEFIAGVVTSDGDGNTTDITYVERVLTSYTIKGTWVEIDGRISNVLAQVDVSNSVLDGEPVPAPAPAPVPDPTP